MATLTFSDALSGARRRGQLTGRSVSPNEAQQIYTNQAQTARQSQLGATSAQPQTSITPSSNTFADYQRLMAKQMEDFQKYQEAMNAHYESLLQGINDLNQPKALDPEKPLANVAPPGQTPQLGTGWQDYTWPGSYTYDPLTNAYKAEYATEHFIGEDPGRTVFNPATNAYEPATGALRWGYGEGWTQFDSATKTHVPLPSQVFGGSGVPTPPKGPFIGIPPENYAQIPGGSGGFGPGGSNPGFSMGGLSGDFGVGGNLA